MIADRRSSALVANFAGQWLYLRNLASAVPDPRRSPTSTTTCAGRCGPRPALLREPPARGPQRGRAPHRRLHVPQRAPGAPLRSDRRLRRPLPSGRRRRPQPPRPPRPRQHPHSDLVRHAHVAGPARQVDPHQPARLAAAGAAARCARAPGGRSLEAGHDARAAGAAPRERLLRQLPRQDGPTRVRARELRCDRALALGGCRWVADRRRRRAAGRLEVREPRRAAPRCWRAPTPSSPPSPRSCSPTRSAVVSRTDMPAVRAIVRQAAEKDYRFQP